MSVHNDVSPPLRDIGRLSIQSADSITPNLLTDPILNFEGMTTFLAPPAMQGAVGQSHYVQILHQSYQVFDKTTGGSVLGPNTIMSMWVGFGGLCQTNGGLEPLVVYDQIANRWLVVQFAGTLGLTEACIAVSNTSDATGSYNRYAFHFPSNNLDDWKLGIWPDAYYMSAAAFDANTAVAVALDRAAMIAGQPASYQLFPRPANERKMLPATLEGSTSPPPGAPNPFLQFPSGGSYKLFRYHVDFATPANSTFTGPIPIAAAAFMELCPSNSSCVPQPATATRVDGVGDRLMSRLAYRNLSDHEMLVGNFSVQIGISPSQFSAIRWFEMRRVTSGTPIVFQEATFAPDNLWRWLGSSATDQLGNIALGYSISHGSLFPGIRYAGRLATGPPGSMQGDFLLINGTGSQTSPSHTWGPHSAMTVDPVDERTFWFTSEYYTTTTSYQPHTRIGSFRFPVAPAIQSIVSRKIHGGMNFDIALPATGNPGIECRRGSGANSNNHQVIVTFAEPVNVDGVVVNSIDGQATATTSVAGAAVIVDLSSVANAQIIRITLTNVAGDTDIGNVSFPMSFLLGDTTGNGSVNASDVGQTKARAGQVLSETNFRSDLNENGTINASDVAIVKAQVGTSLP